MALSECVWLSHPDHGFGNSLCFDKQGRYTFGECCGRGPSSGCFHGAYTYEACCYSAPVVWQRTEGVAEAILNMPVGHWGHYEAARAYASGVPCARGARRLEQWQDLTGAWDEALCAAAGGVGHNVTVVWADAAVERTSFRFCAPESCAVEDVAARLAPGLFARASSGVGRFRVVHQIFASRLDRADLSGEFLRVGSAGTRIPPASLSAIAEYMRSFRVCGRCELSRYGSRHDGGYLMCKLGGRGERYLAAYSYGIDEADDWGEAISIATGAVVHQYDCTIGGEHRPCSPPCRSVFHDECVASRDVNVSSWRRQPLLKPQWRYSTLASHLLSNGHANAEDGQLLLKADMEGAEWEVFCEVSVDVLRKFRQLVVEFHFPYVGELTDSRRLLLRSSALKKLLSVFVVVHVHPNNACYDPPASCLEVTFANRAFVDGAECVAPTRHELDTPNSPGRPDIDLAGLFREETA